MAQEEVVVPKTGKLAKLVGIKPQPLMTRRQKLDQAMEFSMTEIDRLEQEATQWRQKALELDEALEIARKEHPLEIATLKHEFESKLKLARDENDRLRVQLNEVGEKMERYLTEKLRLESKCADLEFFSRSALHKVALAANAESDNIKTYCDDLHGKPASAIPEINAEKIGETFGFNTRKEQPHSFPTKED
jgi:chromosome segregation ATPase